MAGIRNQTQRQHSSPSAISLPINPHRFFQITGLETKTTESCREECRTSSDWRTTQKSIGREGRYCRQAGVLGLDRGGRCQRRRQRDAGDDVSVAGEERHLMTPDDIGEERHLKMLAGRAAAARRLSALPVAGRVRHVHLGCRHYPRERTANAVRRASPTTRVPAPLRG